MTAPMNAMLITRPLPIPVKAFVSDLRISRDLNLGPALVIASNAFL